MQEVQFNPVGDIKKAIEAAQEQDIEDKCPECFENQLQWFCSSVVPKCGSVRASLESAILPAISKVNRRLLANSRIILLKIEGKVLQAI